ncbi:hypothetical protein ACN4EG_20200 [Alkalinema pantanalense CENA528]|uniref:hypothetical protein n=1 Tax=Alkalinema pantanalense TaxID=1620705 RepID=UPI003D6DC871
MLNHSKILQEIQSVPEEYLDELYELIHNFRTHLKQPKQHEPRQPGLLKGKLGEAFFEPLPEEELQQWE